MRSWACTLVPIAFTGVFATSRYISSLDPSWDASPQLTRRRSKGQSMFYVRSLVRSSSAGFGSVALPSHFIHSVAGAQRQPSAEVRRRLTLTARKLRDNRHTRNCYSSSRDLSKWRPTGQRRASSSTSSSSSSSSSNSSSRRRSCGTGTGTSTIRYSSSSNSSNNGENAAGTRGSHASADNQRAAQDDATTAVTPRLENSASDKNAVLASWPASLTPSTTGKIYISEIVKEAAQWLELHGVIDPEPSAAELLAKAAGYRSPQDMSSRLRVASLCDSTSRNVPPSLEMTSAEWDEMRRLCELRAAQHVPVQYLVGEWDFYGLSLEMQPPTLIPRPETEELVDRVLQWVRQEGVETGNNNGFVVCHGDGGDGVGVSVSGGGNDGDAAGGLHFLDVGSGTGVIGLTLLKELPGARCVAIDAQPAAVRLSRRNAERTGLQPRYSCFHKKIAEFGSGFRAGAGDGFGERTGFGAEFGTGAGNEKPVSAETGDKAGIKSAEGGVAEHEGGGGGGGDVRWKLRLHREQSAVHSEARYEGVTPRRCRPRGQRCSGRGRGRA